ncbi:hypothetical protein SAMN05421678_10458 [Actinopolymorpha cephalotaxi]|uniref:Uncharacterized protein n=1 Tax=Actinopolymorpha cephalotaxi TaxID=504797 RepID=A0A1I2PBT9_9ACTN|nr:hypothetical protein [Actinopolymorpha cephalotaxi]NYH83690.1 hypothetical protein [Actinopolymorpha cephalotaxi]SFG12973.1 hypothetical protein SAMN05421678_10458 [Actinopolymorpha cephalotaxi]
MNDRQRSASRSGSAQGEAKKTKAGAFDVRIVIAGLIGFYGVVLVVMGLVADDAAARAKTGDVNANLWAGIGMVVFAAAFVVWARLRPVVVTSPESPAEDAGPAGGRPAGKKTSSAKKASGAKKTSSAKKKSRR